MILNKNSIQNQITNTDKDCFQPASYDLRLDSTVEKTKLTPGQSILVSTIESVNLNNSTAAFIKDKSSLMREGLSVIQGYVDPGFRGNLTIRVQNIGKHNIVLHNGQKIAQLVFFQTEPTEEYNGHYQDSEGIVKSRVKL